jgi:hypothetical protein
MGSTVIALSQRQSVVRGGAHHRFSPEEKRERERERERPCLLVIAAAAQPLATAVTHARETIWNSYHSAIAKRRDENRSFLGLAYFPGESVDLPG